MRRVLAAIVLAAAVMAPGSGAQGMTVRQTPSGYVHAVLQVCTGALLFDGTHRIGTRAGALAVAADIRATGRKRLDRVAAIPSPRATAQLAARWISVERRLVEAYASAYVQIWFAIERADSPSQHTRLPARLRSLIDGPGKLARQAAVLELRLDVPDCTGGGSRPDPSQAAGF